MAGGVNTVAFNRAWFQMIDGIIQIHLDKLIDVFDRSVCQLFRLRVFAHNDLRQQFFRRFAGVLNGTLTCLRNGIYFLNVELVAIEKLIAFARASDADGKAVDFVVEIKHRLSGISQVGDRSFCQFHFFDP